jgi:hypothetical protein
MTPDRPHARSTPDHLTEAAAAGRDRATALTAPDMEDFDFNELDGDVPDLDDL